MYPLKDKLTAIITSKPDVIQFARDRKYEEAWIIPITEERPQDAEINTYISKESFKTLIVEYIWNSTDDDSRFVLTFFLDSKCKLQNPQLFMKICLDLFYGYNGFTHLIDTLDSEVVGHAYLLTNNVNSVNIGVFNHWLSVGPVDVWKIGEEYNPLIISQKIKMRPDVEKTNLNYQGLLFRFNIDGLEDGPYYGIKTPCCKKEDVNWCLDYNKIDHWMRTMLGI